MKADFILIERDRFNDDASRYGQHKFTKLGGDGKAVFNIEDIQG
ncbi:MULTISPECIES: hypothetical protein [unclassified Shewanella]|nr:MULTISPECIES: hypothetical protein [unclassified Shewanella]